MYTNASSGFLRLMLVHLTSWSLDQILEKPLVILTLVAYSPVLLLRLVVDVIRHSLSLT